MNSLILVLAAFAGDPTFDPTSAYHEQKIEGFRVLVNPRVEAHPAESREALEELKKQLTEISKIVRGPRLDTLKKVTIWMEWESKPGGAAEFHPSASWLKDNGYNPEKAGGIEINNARNFVKWSRTTQPSMILHEMAHSYHRNVVGHDDERVKAAFQRATDSKTYESVEFVSGGKRKAYALTNIFEYFAEATEAYLGKNDFYPFTRKDLEIFDPETYRLMQQIWSEESR